MTELIQFISDTGVLIVIAAVFIWDKVVNAKKTGELLQEISINTKLLKSMLDTITAAVNNTTTALNMVEMTQKGLVEDMSRHDKRAEFMNNDIKKILEHTRKTDNK